VIQRYRFQIQPFFTRSMIAGFIVAPLAFLLPWLLDLQSGAPDWRVLTFGVFLLALCAYAAIMYRAKTRPNEPMAVELHDDHAVLPLSSQSIRVRRVPYDELLSIQTFGRDRSRRLVIASRRRNFSYLARSFVGGGEAVTELAASLRSRLAATPRGAELLREMDERDVLFVHAMMRRPVCTIGILVLLVVAYFWTSAQVAPDEPFGLARFGANVPALVTDGEWYRLLSANFLHAGLLHIYLNGFAIFVLGMLLERMIGSWRFLCIYVVSALAGSVTSTLASNAVMSVGASTAVFGLLGALALINYRFRLALPGIFRQPLRWWVIILGVNAFLPILFPMIDYMAHIGGFVGGVAVAAMVCPDVQSIRNPENSGTALRIVTAGLSVLCVWSLLQAVLGAGEWTGAKEARIARTYVLDPESPPEALNNLAWFYAIDPDAAPAQLDLAEEAARRAVAAEPDIAAFIDTLATVEYRKGRFEDAVRTQKRAIEAGEERALISQLARFLDARNRGRGSAPAARGEMPDVSVTAVPAERGRSARVDVELARSFPNGLEIFALDKTNGALTGTLHILMGPGIEAGSHTLDLDGGFGGEPWLQTSALTVADVDTTGCDCEPGEISGRYYPMDRGVLGLP